MEERSRDVIGLLEELTEQNRQQTASLKKQLFVTRILAAAGCVLAAAVIAVFLLIVPPMLQIISQGQETLVEATDTLQTAQETLTDIQTLFDENGLVWQSSEALSQATEKLNRMDIESLNSAIRDLLTSQDALLLHQVLISSEELAPQRQNMFRSNYLF